MTPDEEDSPRSHVSPADFPKQFRNLQPPGSRIMTREQNISLNSSQRQHLLITCKHIDGLLGDIEETLNAAASKSIFPSYVGDIAPSQRKTIEDYIALLRDQPPAGPGRQSLPPPEPHISALHSIHVGLTFVEIAIAELDPRYMRGYGPVSEQGAADLHRVMAELQSGAVQMHRFILQPRSDDRRGDDCEAG